MANGADSLAEPGRGVIVNPAIGWSPEPNGAVVPVLPRLQAWRSLPEGLGLSVQTPSRGELTAVCLALAALSRLESTRPHQPDEDEHQQPGGHQPADPG